MMGKVRKNSYYDRVSCCDEDISNEVQCALDVIDNLHKQKPKKVLYEALRSQAAWHQRNASQLDRLGNLCSLNKAELRVLLKGSSGVVKETILFLLGETKNLI